MKIDHRGVQYVHKEDTTNRPSDRTRGLRNIAGNQGAKQRGGSYFNDTNSTEDYTKRIVRRGHFQDEDVEYIEVEINEPNESIANIELEDDSQAEIKQKTIGFW